jgi:hypothetical protein
MADLRLVERRVYELKANWKLIIQNYSSACTVRSSTPSSTGSPTT